MIRDRIGTPLEEGCIVKYGNIKGIVRQEDREGIYVEFKNGYKLRASECYKSLKVVAHTRKKVTA